MAQCLLHDIPAVLVLSPSGRIIGRFVSVQLESRLHEPDGIRGGACHDACDSRCSQMDAPDILAALRVEMLVQYAFPVPVHVEVDAPRRHDTYQVRAEAAEEGAESLVFVDGV